MSACCGACTDRCAWRRRRSGSAPTGFSGGFGSFMPTPSAGLSLPAAPVGSSPCSPSGSLFVFPGVMQFTAGWIGVRSAGGRPVDHANDPFLLPRADGAVSSTPPSPSPPFASRSPKSFAPAGDVGSGRSGGRRAFCCFLQSFTGLGGGSLLVGLGDRSPPAGLAEHFDRSGTARPPANRRRRQLPSALAGPVAAPGSPRCFAVCCGRRGSGLVAALCVRPPARWWCATSTSRYIDPEHRRLSSSGSMPASAWG